MILWDNFLKEQDSKLGKEIVDKWLRPLKVLDFNAGNLYLEAKNSFQLMWFEEHIREKVRLFFRNNNHRKINVHLTLSSDVKEKEKKNDFKTNTTSLLHFKSDNLDPLAILENFIPTQGSFFPYQIVKQIGQEPVDNPLYFYGMEGTGKSHLLMSIAQKLRENGKKIQYVRAETLTQHVISAFRCGQIDRLRKTYRAVDGLIIDDVDVLSKRTATQEELFHTFNAFHMSHRPIILAGKVAPSLLDGIEPRLISRFEWGLTLRLEKPTEEELKAILLKRCQLLQFKLTEEVESLLLTTFFHTKSLLRALDALILRSHLDCSALNKDRIYLSKALAERYLSELIEEENRRDLTPNKIVNHVANFYGIDADDILGKSQRKECVKPRQIAMYLCRMKLKLPYTKIGEVFKRDYTTAMTSIKQIEQRLEQKDRDLASSLNSILRDCS